MTCYSDPIAIKYTVDTFTRICEKRLKDPKSALKAGICV